MDVDDLLREAQARGPSVRILALAVCFGFVAIALQAFL